MFRADPRRLTPLRALFLLRECERAIYFSDSRRVSTLEKVACALDNHVRVGLARGRRRRR